jgi:hypothetical protein
MGESDLDLIRGLLGTHPDWHRTRLMFMHHQDVNLVKDAEGR